MKLWIRLWTGLLDHAFDALPALLVLAVAAGSARELVITV